MSLTESLATFFRDHPDEWINGFVLMKIGGSFAFRSRCSDLRRFPYGMTIENKVERHKRVLEDGTVKHWSETYYRYLPPSAPTQPSLLEEPCASPRP